MPSLLPLLLVATAAAAEPAPQAALVSTFSWPSDVSVTAQNRMEDVLRRVATDSGFEAVLPPKVGASCKDNACAKRVGDALSVDYVLFVAGAFEADDPNNYYAFDTRMWVRGVGLMETDTAWCGTCSLDDLYSAVADKSGGLLARARDIEPVLPTPTAAAPPRPSVSPEPLPAKPIPAPAVHSPDNTWPLVLMGTGGAVVIGGLTWLLVRQGAGVECIDERCLTEAEVLVPSIGVSLIGAALGVTGWLLFEGDDETLSLSPFGLKGTF